MENTFISARMQIMENDGKLNTLKDEPQVDADIQIRVRGNSSRLFDKVGYLFKFTDTDGSDKPYEVMEENREEEKSLSG